MPWPSQQTGVSESETAQSQTEMATVRDAESEERRRDARVFFSPQFFMWVPLKGQQDTHYRQRERKSEDTDTDTESQVAYLAIDLRTNGGPEG